MNKNILVIAGSPRSKGSSEAILDSLIDKLNEKKHSSYKLCLNKEMRKSEDNLIKAVDDADALIISLPIYENSVPSLVLQFLELIYSSRDKLSTKDRKLFVITNSGFAQVEASKAAINTCKLFSRDTNFKWMGGIAVAPGTLIDGKKLEETGKTYKTLLDVLDIIAEAISSDTEIPKEAFEMMKKTFFNPTIYKIASKLIEIPVMKKIGKSKFFNKPLIS